MQFQSSKQQHCAVDKLFFQPLRVTTIAGRSDKCHLFCIRDKNTVDQFLVD